MLATGGDSTCFISTVTYLSVKIVDYNIIICNTSCANGIRLTNLGGYSKSDQSIIPSEQYLSRSIVLMGITSSNNCQHSRISFLEISDILFAANNLLPLQEPIRFKIHCFCHCSIITNLIHISTYDKSAKNIVYFIKCSSLHAWQHQHHNFSR